MYLCGCSVLFIAMWGPSESGDLCARRTRNGTVAVLVFEWLKRCKEVGTWLAVKSSEVAIPCSVSSRSPTLPVEIGRPFGLPFFVMG